MENETLDRKKSDSQKNFIKISLGVLRAAVIINVIYYLVKMWAGQEVSPVVLLPAAVCVVLGAAVYIYKRKLT